jgi:hypothetical protein
MSDDDTVVTDHRISLTSSRLARARPRRCSVNRMQTREKCGQRFDETQISSAVGRLVCNRLQLGTDCVFAPAQIGHAMAQLVERQKHSSAKTLDIIERQRVVRPVAAHERHCRATRCRRADVTAGDALPRRTLRLAKAGGAFIGGVAQHCPGPANVPNARFACVSGSVGR